MYSHTLSDGFLGLDEEFGRSYHGGAFGCCSGNLRWVAQRSPDGWKDQCSNSAQTKLLDGIVSNLVDFVGQSTFFFPPCVGTDFSPAFISLARIDRLCCRSVCEDFIYHSLASSRWYFILELWDPSDGSGTTKLDDVTHLSFLFHPCFSCFVFSVCDFKD